jgi:hypothetical protein
MLTIVCSFCIDKLIYGGKTDFICFIISRQIYKILNFIRITLNTWIKRSNFIILSIKFLSNSDKIDGLIYRQNEEEKEISYVLRIFFAFG